MCLTTDISIIDSCLPAEALLPSRSLSRLILQQLIEQLENCEHFQLAAVLFPVQCPLSKQYTVEYGRKFEKALFVERNSTRSSTSASGVKLCVCVCVCAHTHTHTHTHNAVCFAQVFENGSLRLEEVSERDRGIFVCAGVSWLSFVPPAVRAALLVSTSTSASASASATGSHARLRRAATLASISTFTSTGTSTHTSTGTGSAQPCAPAEQLIADARALSARTGNLWASYLLGALRAPTEALCASDKELNINHIILQSYSYRVSRTQG